MLKRLFRSRPAMQAAAWLIGAYIGLVYATSRWTLEGYDHVEAALKDGKGVILAFWHGRLLMAAAVRQQTDARVFMLISAHRDGEIIAQGVSRFGIEFIRGSAANPKKPEKNKSGASAIAQMAAALKENAIVGFTPDGPRGPGEKLKPGVIRLAQMSGAPIIPAAYSITRGKRLSTWDRFLLAAPFSKGYYIAGAPIHVPADASAETLERLRAETEAALIAATREADRLAGRKTEEDNAG
ncbi:lysophospholipid acyltransferase family protein [Hyphococcus sp.]|uniref:lysophospholipid acyltransferase family protein n=1 Tax=Hyphococcus sp. TaxID=2038636 RepID=UPI003D0ADBB1